MEIVRLRGCHENGAKLTEHSVGSGGKKNTNRNRWTPSHTQKTVQHWKDCCCGLLTARLPVTDRKEDECLHPVDTVVGVGGGWGVGGEAHQVINKNKSHHG